MVSAFKVIIEITKEDKKMEFQLNQIGYVEIRNGRYYLCIEEAYREALKGLSGFSHLNIL